MTNQEPPGPPSWPPVGPRAGGTPSPAGSPLRSPYPPQQTPSPSARAPYPPQQGPYAPSPQYPPQQPPSAPGAAAGRSYTNRTVIIAATVVILVAAGVIGAIAATGKNSTSARTSAAAVASFVSSASAGGSVAPAGKAASSTGGFTQLPIQHEDWRLDSVSPINDGGMFGGRGQITFTGKGSPPSGVTTFAVKLAVNGKQVGELDGSTSATFTGGQATIEFDSSESYVAGPYTYQFIWANSTGSSS